MLRLMTYADVKCIFAYFIVLNKSVRQKRVTEELESKRQFLFARRSCFPNFKRIKHKRVI